MVDKTKHYYTLCKTGSPIDTPVATPQLTPKRAAAKTEEDEGIEEGEEVLKVRTEKKGSDATICDEEDEEINVCDVDEEEVEEEVDVEQSIREAWKEIEEEGSDEEDSVEFEGEVEGEGENEIEITRTEVTAEAGEESLESELMAAEERQEEEEMRRREERQEEEEMRREEAAAKVSKVKAEDKAAEDDGHIQQGLHYRAGDEPEPIDLTHLNVEAAMMCLASKVRVLCGRADSPTLSSRTFRFKELDAARCCAAAGALTGGTPPLSNKLGGGGTGIPKSASHESAFKIPDVPNPNQQEDAIEDWASELRPSMRKLRQGMDSLCKTSRLVCSVLRLQQLKEAVNLSHDIKYRRCGSGERFRILLASQ